MAPTESVNAPSTSAETSIVTVTESPASTIAVPLRDVKPSKTDQFTVAPVGARIVTARLALVAALTNCGRTRPRSLELGLTATVAGAAGAGTVANVAAAVDGEAAAVAEIGSGTEKPRLPVSRPLPWWPGCGSRGPPCWAPKSASPVVTRPISPKGSPFRLASPPRVGSAPSAFEAA